LLVTSTVSAWAVNESNATRVPNAKAAAVGLTKFNNMVDYSGNVAVNQSPLRLMAFAPVNRGQMQRLIKSGCGFHHTEQHWLNLPEDLGGSPATIDRRRA
jgi:hypothetical protein